MHDVAQPQPGKMKRIITAPFRLVARTWHKPVAKVILALLAVFFLIVAIKASQIVAMISAGSAMVPPPTTVTSAKVKKELWEPVLTAVGSVSPVQGATISAEVPGRVSHIGFESGKPVKKGDLLLKIDAGVEEALMRSAEAEAELAKADLTRTKDLIARKVVSQAEFDAANSKFAQKISAVDNMKSLVAKKEIHAPFDGIAGIRTVNPGQMVKEGDPLVSLQTLDKVFVDFSMPQQQIGDLKVGLPVKVTTDALPGREFQGSLTAINSSLDPATRSVGLQATLDNADHALRSGMFGRVRVSLPQQNETLYIPATAISYAPYGNSVYVIEKKHDEKTKKDELILRQQFVRTGETRGDNVAVTEGLKEGDEVVGTGVFKLRNGLNVVVDNKLAPNSQMTPTPADS